RHLPPRNNSPVASSISFPASRPTSCTHRSSTQPSMPFLVLPVIVSSSLHWRAASPILTSAGSRLHRQPSTVTYHTTRSILPMHRNRRLAIIGSEDGGDEVLVLLGDHNQPQEALDLALQTDAEFIGEIFISFAHQDGERQLYHLEEMRPYVGYCDAMPLETPDWRPVAKRNPVLCEDGETVEWVGDVT